MPSVGEDMEQLEFSYITSGTVTLHNDFRKEFFSFFGFSEKQMPRQNQTFKRFVKENICKGRQGGNWGRWVSCYRSNRCEKEKEERGSGQEKSVCDTFIRKKSAKLGQSCPSAKFCNSQKQICLSIHAKFSQWLGAALGNRDLNINMVMKNNESVTFPEVGDLKDAFSWPQQSPPYAIRTSFSIGVRAAGSPYFLWTLLPQEKPRRGVVEVLFLLGT